MACILYNNNVKICFSRQWCSSRYIKCLPIGIYFFFNNAAKPVSNEHLGDKVSAVVLHRWSLWRRPVYNDQKSVNSDIWLLFKGSITFHLVTHDTKINQHVFLFETKYNVVIKQHIINNFKTKVPWEFIMTSRRSTLWCGHYM